MYGYETFHEDLMKNLIESVHNGVSSHAYIFEGEKGLGVLNSARLFAAALTCKNTGVAPCGSCKNCVESKADTNPDRRPTKKVSVQKICVNLRRMWL